MANEDDPLRAAELLCARMAHDLSSSIGVIAALLEIAIETVSAADEPLSLARETADQLAQRLKLIRAAWGPAGDALDLAALRGTAGVLLQSRCVLDTEGVPSDTVFPPDIARILLNLLMLAAEGLPGGGRIGVSGGAADLVLAIAGPRAKWPAGLAGCLANPDAAWRALREPRGFQMAITALMASAGGMRLSLLMAPGASTVPPLQLSRT